MTLFLEGRLAILNSKTNIDTANNFLKGQGNLADALDRSY